MHMFERVFNYPDTTYTPAANGCWIWNSGLDAHGYGQINCPTENGKRHPPLKAHRVIYELLKEPIPVGLEIDHLCRNRRCVNPDHMEPVTRAENVMRGEGLPAKNARKTECHRGHLYTEENTYIRSNGWRVCRACQRFMGRKVRSGNGSGI